MAAPIIVTDHALVRWLSRAGIMDLEPLREALAASLQRAAGAAATLDASQYLILAEGMVFVVQDGKVVTALSEDSRHSRARALVRRDAEQA